MYKITELFDLTRTQAAEYLSGFVYPWEALRGLRQFIREVGRSLDKGEYEEIAEEIWAHKSVTIVRTARISSPCIIGADTELRQGAFIRGGVLVGKKCVVGNSTELKNCILFDEAQTPHFNYVGDSILGYRAHMGAGAVTSNVKLDKTTVTLRTGAEKTESGLKKLGAAVGDYAEVGCNAVLNPGTVIGRRSVVYPLACVRGVVPSAHIYKNKNEIIARE